MQHTSCYTPKCIRITFYDTISERQNVVCTPAGRYKSSGIIDRTGAQTMIYLTCNMISSVVLAHYGVSCAKDWVSGDCGTS